MPRKKKNRLLDAPSVEAWIEDHEPGGIEKLHSANNHGKLTGAAARFVSKYLWSRNPAAMSAEEARGVVRVARAIGAAKRSARWSIAAALIGLVTLFVSGWPYIDEWLKLLP
ncbi:MAG: hypothetical protein ABI409_06235 [Ramlibacter sp.]